MWYFNIINFTRDPKARFNFSGNHKRMPVHIKFPGSEVKVFAEDILKILCLQGNFKEKRIEII